MKINRRQIGLLAASTLLALAIGNTALAQQEGVVSSEKILKALTTESKDIVLDASGRAAPPRDPSIDLQVQFDFNSANLKPIGRKQLDELAKALNHKSLSLSGFELAGHTDKVGDAQYNIQLSTDRANSVRAYLISTHGIADQRLQTAGFGFSRLADASRPTAAINRRVEVRRIKVMLPTNGANQANPPAVAPSRSLGGRLVPTPK
jgi:outer membrane protein OmpA-like peptidoglycan-associated protein